MKKFMSSILSLSMALLAIAAPMSVNANEGRSIAGPGESGSYPYASVTRTSWSVPKASGQSITFSVMAKSNTASYTLLNITLTNARLIDKNGYEVCNKIGTGGTCPTIKTSGINNVYTVKAGTNSLAAGYYVNSAFYR